MRDIAREELIAELRNLRPEFERVGVTSMSMFGSRARQDNRSDSDVDLVIDVVRDAKFSLLDLIGVGHIIEDNIGLESSIVVVDQYTRPDFIAEIDRDRISVF